MKKSSGIDKTHLFHAGQSILYSRFCGRIEIIMKQITKITKDNFDTEVLESRSPVVVDFFASWCGPCRAMGTVIEDLSEARADVKFCKADIDEVPEIAEEFGVMSVPTLVLVKNGSAVASSVGARPASAVEAMIDSVQ